MVFLVVNITMRQSIHSVVIVCCALLKIPRTILKKKKKMKSNKATNTLSHTYRFVRKIQRHVHGAAGAVAAAAAVAPAREANLPGDLSFVVVPSVVVSHTRESTLLNQIVGNDRL